MKKSIFITQDCYQSYSDHQQGRRASGMLRKKLSSLAGTCGLLLLSAMALFIPRASAQSLVPCPQPSQALITIPEIKSTSIPAAKGASVSTPGKILAELTLTDGLRTLWGAPGDARCASQYIRFFQGRNLLTGAPVDPLFSGAAPIPGPTFRSRVGDLIEIAFNNRVNTQHFPNSLDRGETGQTDGCDVTYAGSAGKGSQSANADTMPNCLHGSSTANVHFHGTHTTPSTTGDNVLVYVRPSLDPLPETAHTALSQIYGNCEQNGSPTQWSQIPEAWRDWQAGLIARYDITAPYKGVPGNLPLHMRLTPLNRALIGAGLWPQYHVGWYPYCFRLPTYVPGSVKMGQAPGTHWYHGHKHGSTALNVANGMTGAFIIEGQYDADLQSYYTSTPGQDLTEHVMVIQQLTTVLNLTQPGQGPGTRKVPLLSVNGSKTPQLTMQPNQVQLWRFVNGAERDATYFQNFTLQGATTPCSGNPATPCMHWRQIAQDGVQFDLANYQGTKVDNQLYLAPGNRADFLLQAPSTPGVYNLNVVGALCRNLKECSEKAQEPALRPQVLLTVNVTGAAINPPMTFLPNSATLPFFKNFPVFLKDIPASDIFLHRELVFFDDPFQNGAAPKLEINGAQFNDEKINQSMALNSAEEWKVSNKDNAKEHPFHIHVNPFQIIELFEPQNPKAIDKNDPCYVNPDNPATFKPCPALQPTAPWVWWDTFAIPAAQQIDLTTRCTKNGKVSIDNCPKQLQPYTQCAAASGGNPAKCTEYIPGYFKMRSRFVDYTGQYVLHCHILTHEDRGMMQLIEVVPDKTLYSHH
ncbi:MAG TPA: multicopper oxidase domain-containing protein [Candidatus Saccharimonadales bacterium]|jgi:FtsP/CotA-like multicopper oxidase with cupredoxin domain|nr:multicopper oxidase domain-containing protein [Candidatus Saccharimonadales bacterium]